MFNYQRVKGLLPLVLLFFLRNSMNINPGRRTLELLDICQSKVTRGAFSLGAMYMALHFHETNPCCGEPYVSSEISSGGFEEIQVQSKADCIQMFQTKHSFRFY